MVEKHIHNFHIDFEDEYDIYLVCDICELSLRASKTPVRLTKAEKISEVKNG